MWLWALQFHENGKYLADSIKGATQSEILLEVANSSIQDTDLEFFTLKYAVDKSENFKEMEYSKAQKKWLGKINLDELEAVSI